MESKVYFIDFRATYKRNFSEKLKELLKSAGLEKCFDKRDLVALKMHFGETGNTAFIRPVYIRQIVKAIKNEGGVPFLTDANTLYAGTRGDTPNHLVTAITNGFDFAVTDAPIVIADGLRGAAEIAVEIEGRHISVAYVGTEIVQSDSLISVAHFKGHELTGFGGAIKNVGMGCASRKGKMVQHSGVSPKIDISKCTGCRMCADHCVHNAIEMVDSKAEINERDCTGCGECILICEYKAVKIQWSRSVPVLLETMVDYCAATLENKKGKMLFVNFINAVSPACDCAPYNDAPIVRDIGVVASTDPVAADQASVDMVNSEPALPGSCIGKDAKTGSDKFRLIYPDVDWEHQLKYAEEIGLGSRTYKLETI